MNIIQVCPYDLSIPGGVQTHVAQLSNQLAQGSHKLMVLTPILKKSKIFDVYDYPVHQVTRSKRINFWGGTSIDISYLSNSDKVHIRKLIEKFNPDIIHFHTIWNPFMQLQLLNMLDSSVKKIATFHDTPPDSGFGKIIGGNFIEMAVRYFSRRLDGLISVSESQRKAMGMDESEKGKRVIVIPNGIDSSVIDKSDSPKRDSEQKFRLIFIGRLEERKGVFDLLEVYERLSAEKLDKRISLTIVGDGPLRNSVDEYISKKKLENIEVLLADDDLKFKKLGKSDLMVAPALYGESFGIVLLEAMAMGVKVVGYGNAGYLNIGRNYGVENFPKPGDVNGLHQIIKEHIEKPETKDHLITKGLKIAKDHDWKNIATKIEQVYERA